MDILQPNAAVTGGITDWLRIHAYATEYGVPLSPCNLQAVHIDMAVGLPNVQWMEHFMPDNPLVAFKARLFARSVLEEETREDRVFLKAPCSPGLRLALDAEFAAQHRVK